MGLTPYQAGEAVFIITNTTRKSHIILTLGRVTRVQARVTVETATGRMVRKALRLVYAAYCPRCEVPARSAFLGGDLVCPSCGAIAESMVPPLDVVARWFDGTLQPSVAHMHHAMARAVVEGRTAAAGQDDLHAWRRAHNLCEWSGSPNGPPKYGREALLQARASIAEMLAWIDEEIADADGTGLAIDRPPRWTPPADDQQPDGGDDLTSWLGQQMGGA